MSSVFGMLPLHHLNKQLNNISKYTCLMKIRKSQAPKTKTQTNPNDPNSKYQTKIP